MNLSKNTRGFTLLELVVAMGATLAVTAVIVRAIIALDAEQAVRKKVAELQTNARQALALVEADLRHASLGSSTGVVWQASGGNRVSRPAVQVLTGLPGGTTGAIKDAKPGTDAVLVVEAIPGPTSPRTVTTRALSTSVGAFDVASAAGFGAGDTVLIGDYGDATWGTVGATTSSGTTQQLTLSEASVNVLPGQPVPKLGPGAPVRRARTRLYYVTTRDELVRITLAAPRPPTASEIGAPEVLAVGVENMQVDCAMSDGGTAILACGAVLDPADPVSSEAAAAFGTFATGNGPRLSAGNVSRLRGVVVNVAVRSRTPLMDGNGDPKIPLVGASGVASALGPGSATGVPASSVHARRSYRLAAGIRNTSLESL